MDEIKEAILTLNRGGIVIFPTDTAFGIGCRIDKPAAVKRLFEIRKRPVSQPVPVLVDSFGMAQDYWQSPIPDIVRQLTKQYWPGGLTIIYKCNDTNVSALVCGGGTNIGLRMPDHDIPLTLIRETGVPILGPSANFHGANTPFSFKDIDRELIGLVDFVMPGATKIKISSTVVDCTVAPYKIVRQGAVKL